MDNFCLKWNEFEANLRESFTKLREDEKYFDVTLACDDGYQIEAHKLILIAGSNFFSNIFTKVKESNVYIYLKGVSGADLHHVVNFLYKGEAYIDQDKVNTFLDTAQELQLKGLY